MDIILIDYKSKKWTWITPLQTSWQPPSENEGYTIDSERNFTRLVQANAFHINYGDNISSFSYVLYQTKFPQIRQVFSKSL